jgi:hypothetical protein
VEIELSLHERELLSTQPKHLAGKFSCFLLMTAAEVFEFIVALELMFSLV